ncbi:MAG: hypothetical protein EWV53_09120 [Microcystis panniformis Mp_MB_F_20051200_S9]|uniref:Profilin n=1 Tax=Microcystis panniformis Mp_MB_F_20051200_S9 TaxID=2486223 RepID=A0A552Q1P5_9CHRO|nr:MAG: hypothetical protein EWV87_18210 [Microcystis panniformis Mp_GB_SS_20050300_S99]TRV48148.1 MAG: hypothetical protein EWV42_15235 [Microcystis panniformis Mp_GB_SS_20050300_S99D]TRV53061.1 MAG: hypothetical protein EWV43_00720 [Microcystis panniformis Mp_MB_F_20080800_S26D]TRV56067.1 MAG: hypothetical protein EWV69_19090 [Microcystis panniformis Mp_MB_F_20080800_S26]TRV63130.1 MAG: hypothetical protein EWV53_09120 [Microcystis panniformis Mp_MB_F_20051200_S9]TRV68932.1 MAG: hypothetical
MSGWDSYIDNLIAQSNDSSGKAHCGKVAIISLDNGASWISPNYPGSLQLSATEGSTVAKMMKSGDFTSAQANGIVLEGIVKFCKKYMQMTANNC